MDAAVVVDASVWVSGFMSQDANHQASRLWMEHYIAEGGLIVAPAFVLIEVAGAISRLSGQRRVARQAIRTLYDIRAMRFLALDTAVVWASVDIAIDLQLRAGDTTYVAIASQYRLPLVSWDNEQLRRAANVTATYTPSTYVF